MKQCRSKASAHYGQKRNKSHVASTLRWAKRKEEEIAESVERHFDDLTLAGGHKRLAWQNAHKHAVIAKAKKAERDMLATTSLKDLIH